MTITTDGFGNVWFEDLKIYTFLFKTENTGFESRTVTRNNIENDVN